MNVTEEIGEGVISHALASPEERPSSNYAAPGEGIPSSGLDFVRFGMLEGLDELMGVAFAGNFIGTLVTSKLSVSNLMVEMVRRQTHHHHQLYFL